MAVCNKEIFIQRETEVMHCMPCDVAGELYMDICLLVECVDVPTEDIF